MKKIALLLGTVLFTIGISYAQTADTLSDGLVQNPKFRMGLSFSGVFSWFAPNGGASLVKSDGARFNIAYGLHTDFGLGTNHNYYFSTGVFALNTGGTLTYDYVDSESKEFSRTVDFRFNYIDIPLTMMLRTNEIGYTVYYARVGIDNGLQFKSVYNSKDIPSGGGDTKIKEDSDSPDYGILYRAGLHIEAGAEFNLTGTTNFFVGFEWNNGLNNIFSKELKGIDKEDGQQKRIKGNSNLLMLNVGVYF